MSCFDRCVIRPWLVILAILLLLPPTSSQAQTTWTGSVSSDWFNPSNWDAGLPTAGVDARLNGGPDALLISQTSAARSLTLGSDLPSNLTIIGGGDLITSEDSVVGELAGTSRLSIGGFQASWQGDGKLTVGKAGNGVVNLTAGGSLRSGKAGTVVGAVIAESLTSVSSVNVSGAGAFWDVLGGMNIGVGGWASMDITDGGDVWSRDQVSSTAIGSGSNAQIKVTDAGSRWKAEGINLAVRGTSSLEVSAGGEVEAFRMNVGVETSSFGKVVVKDRDSKLLVNDLTVATFGRGELQVLDGATVGVSGETLYSLAPVSGGLASLLVSGPGSALVGRSLVVGGDGSASLRANQGGVIFTNGGGIRIGPSSIAQLSDNGSTMRSTKDLIVEGQLTVSESAILESVTGIIQNEGSSASVDVTRSGWTTIDSLRIGEVGSASVVVRDESFVQVGSTKLGGSSSSIVNLLIDHSQWQSTGGGTEITGRITGLSVVNGGAFLSGAFFNLNPVATGNASVLFADSQLFCNELLVGGAGTSNLFVLKGSSVSAERVSIEGEEIANIQIAGPETSFSILGELTVKGSGINNFAVGDGASLRSSKGTVGSTDTGISAMNIVGEGTSWQATDIIAGDVGQGIISVSSGGMIESSKVLVGEQAGSFGTMEVFDVGSTWNIRGSLTLGQQGTGSLAIRNGGIVTNSTAAAATSLGSLANISLAGEGSQWISSGRVQLGFVGRVTLDVDDGALLQAPEFIMVNVMGELDGGTIDSPLIALFGGSLLNNGTIIGDITVGAGGLLTGSGVFDGTVNLSSGGIFSPGNSPGTATMPMTIWGAGGIYRWEINALQESGGLEGNPIGWDLWNTGDLSIDGLFTIELKTLTPEGDAGLLSGWNPARSHLWRIATADNGAFADLSNLQLSTSPIANTLAGGTFALRASADGNELFVRFSAIPEASSIILVGVAGLLGIGFVACRHREIASSK